MKRILFLNLIQNSQNYKKGFAVLKMVKFLNVSQCLRIVIRFHIYEYYVFIFLM